MLIKRSEGKISNIIEGQEKESKAFESIDDAKTKEALKKAKEDIKAETDVN